MRLDDAGSGARLRPWFKPIVITLTLVAAIAIPLSLYLSRGRKVPLRVLLDTPIYVVAAGESVEIRSRIWPISRQVTRRWRGPGVSPKARDATLVWTAPKTPGVYTVSLNVRYRGSHANDAISLRVLAAPLSGYPLDRPPEAKHKSPLLALPPCSTALRERLAPKVRLRVHGKPCLGGRVVFEVTTSLDNPRLPPSTRAASPTSQQSTVARRTTISRQSTVAAFAAVALRTAHRHRDSPWLEVRLPRQTKTDSIPVEILLVPRDARCLIRVTRPVSLDRTCGGAAHAKGLVADINWHLTGPGAFVLTAKPPRPPTAAIYRWKLGRRHTRVTTEPRLAYEFPERRATYLIGLTIEAGPQRAHGVRLLHDRTYGRSDLHAAPSPKVPSPKAPSPKAPSPKAASPSTQPAPAKPQATQGNKH